MGSRDLFRLSETSDGLQCIGCPGLGKAKRTEFHDAAFHADQMLCRRKTKVIKLEERLHAGSCIDGFINKGCEEE